MGTLFISYCRQDLEVVNTIVEKLALVGYDFWMDVKDIDPGDDFINEIVEGVNGTDVYMVFLSKASVVSRYVDAELSYAVQRAIEEPQFRIIPILLEKIVIPDVLANRSFIDATNVSSGVIGQINSILQKEASNPIRELTLTSIGFTMSGETVNYEYDDYSAVDFIAKDCNRVLSELRGKAYGLLMNFVPIEEIEIGSEVPHFTNGIYNESIEVVPGDYIGKCCKQRVTLKVIVFKPNVEKVGLLVEQNFDMMLFNSMTFGFSFPIKAPDTYEIVGKRCLKKLLKDHVVIGNDTEYGAKIRYSEDSYLSLGVSNEQIKITLSSNSAILLRRKLKEFDACQYIKDLLS